MNKLNIQIEVDESLDNNQIIIKAPRHSEKIEEIITALEESHSSFSEQRIIVRESGKEIIVPLTEVLFFESVEGTIFTHTSAEIYRVKQNLTELEVSLPNNFVRISRSAIANLSKISEIKHNIHSSSLLKFADSRKQTIISRRFYRTLKNQLFTYIFNNKEEK